MLSEEPASLLSTPAALAPLLPAPPAAASSSAVDAASLLLEQYAHSLGSASLLQLARSRPSLVGLRELWKRLSNADASSAAAGHDAEASMWCRDFERQTEAMSRAAEKARSQ